MQGQRKYGPPYQLRLPKDAQDRAAQVARELKTDRADVLRSLILDGMGMADPITAATARLVREAARTAAA